MISVIILNIISVKDDPMYLVLLIHIINNRLFKYFYDFYEIYTCSKYFVVSMYIFRFVLNLCFM